MRPEDLFAEIRRVLNGIDKTEMDGGWWETSKGAEFGAQKLKEIRALLERRLK